MQGSFLSSYESKLADWEHKIQGDPTNRRVYESQMSDYIIACMPFLNQYSEEVDAEETTDNFFGAKETKGLQKKDIYTDYLVDVEKQNINRPVQRIAEVCTTCGDEGNIVHFPDTSELVCDLCGRVISVLISEELTYREEQETSSKIVSYSYKRENHFSEWLSQLPFDKHCPTERKNFLSYSYVLYKFCELLSEDEYLPLFPLLKSKEKLFQQDCIWRQICKELRWEFIPTI
jgi:hypothetical protein